MPVVTANDASATLLHHYGEVVFIDVISVTVQTFFFGIYAAFMGYITHGMMKKGLESLTRRIMFYMIIFMFVLSALSLTFNAAGVIHEVFVWFMRNRDRNVRLITTGVVFRAVVLINYILTDGIVVWRAWVLCSADDAYRRRRLLYIPIVILGLTTLSVTGTIFIRIALSTQLEGTSRMKLNDAIDYCQVANLVLSLLTNILSTSVVGLKAWRYRQWLREELQVARRNNSRGEKIMMFLIESGVLYCISGLIALVCSFIRLPSGALGDIYTPINVQIAGIYPIVVFLAVVHNNNDGGTMFNSKARRPSVTQPHVNERSGMDSIHFVYASGLGEISNAA